MDFSDDFDIWSQDLSFPIDSKNSEPVGDDVIASFERKYPPWEFVGQNYHGNFCEIFQARPRGRDIPPAYAAKVLKTEWCNTRIGPEIMFRETEVGRNVSHPHLVPVLDAGLDSEIPYLIQPWLEGKTLKHYLLSGKQAKIHETLWIARQVTEALIALEAAGYCHAAIKPGNIHLSDQGHVTLIDLGMSHRLEKSTNLLDRSICATSTYTAPEIMAHQAGPTIKSDIYALGIVIKEMVSASGFHNIPQVVLDLIRSMTSPDPMERPPTATTMLKELFNVEIQFYRNS